MSRRTAFAPINWAKRVPTMLRTDGRPDTTAHAVLAALATYAKQDGTNARPGIGTLAADTRFSAEYVTEALERCQAAGLISKTGDLTGGTTVWRLHVDVVDEGPTVHEQRLERRRAVDAERQRRRRQLLKEQESARHGAGDRDVTVSEPVTVTVPDTVTVTPSETVTSRSEQRDVTVPHTVSHGPTSVTTAGHQGYIPTELPKGKKKTSSSSRRKSQNGTENRPDVEQLCEHLRDRIIANDCKPPTITEGWRDAARLLLDRDGRDLHKALALIDWATNDSFWKANIKSMPKFREQFDTLRLQALREWEQQNRTKPVRNITAEWQALKQNPAQPGPSGGSANWQPAPNRTPLAATGTDALPLLISLPAPHALPRGETR